MAGDWIKLEVSTPEKSEVLAITASMGWDDADLTVGKLFRMWRWFDQHTIDGNAVRVTPALLDRIVGVSGFCNAVQQVGWLLITDDGVMLPKFDRHNGSSAKARAQTAKRVAKHKANAQGNEQSNAGSVSDALPREEKRREDISIPNGIDESAPKTRRASRKCPDDFAIDDAMRKWAAENVPLVDIDKATEVFRDHTFKTAMTDWKGAWRNWMRREQGSPQHQRKNATNGHSESFRERDERLARERFEEMTGRSSQGAGRVIDITPKTMELIR